MLARIKLLRVPLIIVAVVLIAIWADLNFSWTGYGYVDSALTAEQAFARHRTIWDWMSLLIIPAVLAVGAVYLNQSERRTERYIANERAEDAALETYLQQMSTLLIDKNLCESSNKDEVRSIARAWTLTIARRLGSQRKGTLLQFLHEASLIKTDQPIVIIGGINLSGAFLGSAILDGANLSATFLRGAILHRALLHGAILRFAILSQADLSQADLSQANLCLVKLMGANLSGADLSQADLSGADLSGADLSGANLSGANLSTANLDTASLYEADLREATYNISTGFPQRFTPADHSMILIEDEKESEE